MIESIRGQVEDSGEDWIIVSLGMVSLRINTTRATLSGLGSSTSDVCLFTHLYVREDLVVLYGFGTREERAVFERLIGVTGVGPRAAQAILSTLSTTSLQQSIDDENVDALIRVPGIGRKTAQRVILELKGKLAPVGTSHGVVPAPPDGDLVGLLMGLGYSAAESAEALRQVSAQEGLSDEDRLRAALRHFASP